MELRFDWRIRENANRSLITASTYEWYIYQRYLDEEAERVIPSKLYRLHREAWIHIHKLGDGGLFKPYCCGVDSLRIVERGLWTPTVTSLPPSHLDSAVDQLVNLVYCLSQERTGAVALYGIDLVLAPFVRYDSLDYRSVRQCMQRFVWNLNYPARSGYQTPFTNIIFAVNHPFYRNMPAFVSGRVVGKLGDYVSEALQIISSLIDVYYEGDAESRPFTFPIPSVTYNYEFEQLLRKYDIFDKFWKLTAELGSFYFLNGLDERSFNTFSMCCRVLAEIPREAYGTWTVPPTMGSIGYVSINVPRVVAKYGEKYLDAVYDLSHVAREVLNILRSRYEEFLNMYYKYDGVDFYPITRSLFGRDAFKKYYNTLAVVGLAEAYCILRRDRFFWSREPTRRELNDVVSFYSEVLHFMRGIAEEFSELDNVMYNVEQSPAESTSYKFALADWNSTDYTIREKVRNYVPHALVYTSQNSPPYCEWSLDKRIDLEASTQKLFTGGVIFLMFTDSYYTPEEVYRIVWKALNRGVVYFGYTPTITHCSKCKRRFVGRFEKCPNCNAPTEYWSRIVGYYRPVSAWNEGKRLEFNVRRSIKP